MAQPQAYNRSTQFAAEEASNTGGRSTVRTAQVDAELDGAATSINQIRANLALIQRDDTKLRDGIVEPHTLSSGVLAILATSGAAVRGAWVTARSYALSDVVTQGGNTYVCATAHTSGTFATDLAAGRWVLLALGTGVGASAVSFTPTATVAAVTVQAAVEEVDTDLRALVTAAASGLAASTGSALVGHIQSGTGATATTVQARLRQTFSVKDFGAVGNGTTDDTAAIQAAIDAAEAIVVAYSGVAGVRVLFPAGEYRITSGLTITEDNITLEGDGARASCLLVSSAFNVITATDLIGLTVQGLGIRASSGANLASGAFFYLDNVSNGRFTDLDLRSWYVGFDCLGLTRSAFTRVYCSQAGRTSGVGSHGFNLRGTSTAGGCSGNHFTDCEVWNSSSVADPAYDAAMRATSSDGLYLTQCHFVSGSYGLRLAPTGTTNNDTMASVLVTNCYFDTVGTNNVNISGTASAFRDIRFQNCLMRASGAQGVVVTPDVGSTLIGFQFIGNQIRSSGSAGLTFGDDNIEGAVIQGNVFAQNNTTANASGHDLTLRGDSLIVTGNTFIDGNATGDAINVTIDARRFIVRDNDMTGSTRTTKLQNSASATDRFMLGPNMEGTRWGLIDEIKVIDSTDTTPANAWTYTMEEESILALEAHVVGVRNTFGSGTSVVTAASFFRNGSAAPTQIGTETATVTQESAAGYAVAFAISTNTIQLQVTGLAAGTDYWIARVKGITRKV